MILSAETLDDTRAKIEAGLNKLATIFGAPMTKRSRASVEPKRPKGCAVVIDGDTLRHALDPSIKPLFLSLGTQCDTVVCCRVSPAQKAMTVKLIKDGCNAMTLSIGDGELKTPVILDFLTVPRGQRCCNDSRSEHWVWTPWSRGFTGGHVGRLRVWAIPIPYEATSRARPLVVHSSGRNAQQFLLQGAIWSPPCVMDPDLGII